MRNILFILLFSYANWANAQALNPYITLKFDSLVFYDYEGGKGMPELVDSNGKLSNTVVKRAFIDGTTAKEFSRRLGLHSSYGQSKAFCFDPHLGAVYYLHGRPIATVQICLECNILRSSKKLVAQEQGLDVGGVEKTGEYTAEGMSKSFRKYINSLLKKFKFSHQLDPRGSFTDGYK